MKNKKRKKNILGKFILTTIILFLFTVTNILFIVNLLKLKDIENIIRIIIGLIIGSINIFFAIKYYLYFFKKRRKRKFIIIPIIMILLTLILGFINYNLNKIYNVLDNITENTQHYTLSLVTLSSNKINSKSGINDDIGVIQDENIENGYNFALEIIKKNKIKQKLIKYESYQDIVKDLYNENLKYAFLPDNYITMFSQDEAYKDIETRLKVIHNDTKKVEIASVNKDINKPFTILLMGVDTLNTSYNADTLMLITFNPETLSATMLSIPRDTYTTIACTRGKHKINSSGWYSDKCVVDTVSNLVDIEIDYYAKINFVGIVDLVNALGGIQVDVVYPFCEQNSKRQFGNNMIYVEEGLQLLNGEQALALSRNRHFWPGMCPNKYNEKGYYQNNLRNDITRGLNQQLVVKGILNSLSNVKDLNTIYSILDTIGNNVTTNMDKETILSFYNIFKNIVTTSGLSNIETTFDIQKLAIEVYGTYINISGLNLSMIIPHKNSINTVSNAMKENLGLKEKEVIKTLSFDINTPYEEKTIGKGIYGGTTINLLKDLTGQTHKEANNYCDEKGLNCEFTYTDITDGSFENNQIISQSIPGNYDMSLIGNKKIVFNVAKVTNTTTSFNYSLCTKKEYENNSKCQLPDFTNKSLKDFNTWYKNFSFIKVKLTNTPDTTKTNNLITSQNISKKSIFEIYNDKLTIEIEYIKYNTEEDNSNNDENKEETNKEQQENNKDENNTQNNEDNKENENSNEKENQNENTD